MTELLLEEPVQGEEGKAQKTHAQRSAGENASGLQWQSLTSCCLTLLPLCSLCVSPCSVVWQAGECSDRVDGMHNPTGCRGTPTCRQRHWQTGTSCKHAQHCCYFCQQSLSWAERAGEYTWQNLSDRLENRYEGCMGSLIHLAQEQNSNNHKTTKQKYQQRWSSHHNYSVVSITLNTERITIMEYNIRYK